MWESMSDKMLEWQNICHGPRWGSHKVKSLLHVWRICFLGVSRKRWEDVPFDGKKTTLGWNGVISQVDKPIYLAPRLYIVTACSWLNLDEQWVVWRSKAVSRAWSEMMRGCGRQFCWLFLFNLGMMIPLKSYRMCWIKGCLNMGCLANQKDDWWMDSADHHNYQSREALPRELCSFGAESKVQHFDSYILQEWFHDVSWVSSPNVRTVVLVDGKISGSPLGFETAADAADVKLWRSKWKFQIRWSLIM